MATMGPISSAFPQQNILFDMASGGATQRIENNALMMQQRQQEIGLADQEQVARASAFIDSLPEGERPAAYSAAVQQLQANGFAKKAPPQYPGHDVIKRLASMGTSSEKQTDRAAAKAGWGQILGGEAAAAPAAGGPMLAASGGGGAAPPAELMPLYQEAAARTGIPVDVLIAQHRQESGFNPNATGAAGEIGLGQVKPSTARDPGFGMTGVDPATLRDPRANINFSADYLKARGGGANFADPAQRDRALASYNGGGDPNYVANVGRYLPAGDPRGAAARTGGVDVAGPGAPAPGASTGGMLSGLTPEQMMAVRALSAINAPPAQGLAMIQHFKEQNAAAAHQARQEARQSERDAKQDSRQEDAARLAQEKAARDADEAASLHRGTGMEAQDARILEKSDPSSREYKAAFDRLNAPRYFPDGSVVRPDMSAYDPPTFVGKSSGAGGMTKAPATPTAAVVDGMLGNVASLRTVDQALAELEKRKGAGVGIIAGNTPAAIINRTDPEGVTLRALIADIGSLKIHDRSGAAVSASESPRLVPFIPSISDPPATVRDKLTKFRREYQSALNDSYQVYGPSAGGKAIAPVDAALKDYKAPDQREADAPQIKSDSDYNGLPSGTIFVDPNGVRRKKP